MHKDNIDGYIECKKDKKMGVLSCPWYIKRQEYKPIIKKEIPFAVIIAFLIGTAFGIIVTACMLQIEIVKARHDGIEIGRDYERSIWDRFPTGGKYEPDK